MTATDPSSLKNLSETTDFYLEGVSELEQNEEDRMGQDEMGERRQRRINKRSEKKRKEGCLQELYTVR